MDVIGLQTKETPVGSGIGGLWRGNAWFQAQTVRDRYLLRRFAEHK